jgi:hypothetical protein
MPPRHEENGATIITIKTTAKTSRRETEAERKAVTTFILLHTLRIAI